MLGVAIAAIVMAWSHFLSGHPLQEAFLSATGFLWIWFIVWASVQGFFMVLLSLGLTGGGAAAGGSKLGFGGVMLGAAGGGLVSLLLIGLWAVRQALFLGGTWLLKTAGTAEMSLSEFDRTHLIFGGILIVLGILLSRANASSSKSKSDD